MVYYGIIYLAANQNKWRKKTSLRLLSCCCCFLRVVGQRGRGGGRERILSRLQARAEPDVGLNLTTLRSRLELRSRVRCLTH